MKEGLVVDAGYVCKEDTYLTVSKTSLFFVGDGFTAYDCKGALVFRVDSYGPDMRDKLELVLMDAHGRCLLTVRRKVCFILASFFFFFFPGLQLQLSDRLIQLNQRCFPQTNVFCMLTF